MRRMRLTMFLAVMAVTTLGVQAVQAVCPRAYIAIFPDGWIASCTLVASSPTVCEYSCVITTEMKTS